jgi:hypothetical protein
MIGPDRFLLFADPGFAPDWPSRDDPARPKWPTGRADAPPFVAYCLAQLVELDRRAAALERERPSPMLDALFEASEEESRDYRRLLPRFLDEIGMDRAEFEKRKRREAERLFSDTQRRGPTRADPYERHMSPTARAAEDMAKLRFVIFPRFWGRKNISAPSVSEIAAQRWGCKSSAAESWYENEGVSKKWKASAAQSAKREGGKD